MTACDWTVTKVMDDNPTPYDGPKGKLVTYWMAVSDGHEDKFVYWTRQPESAPPAPGQTIYGTYEDKGLTAKGKPKLKFKPLQREDGAPPARPSTSAAANTRPIVTTHTVGPSQQTNGFDSRSARIERQHSQEMAIRLIADGHGLAQAPIEKSLKHWTDHFCEDLDDYVKAQHLRGYKAKQDSDAEQVPAIKEPSESRKFAHVKPEKTLEDAVLDGDIADSDDIPF